MQDFSSTKAFYTSDLLHKWKLLPFIAKADDLPFTCNMCGYVNAHVNKFCTNCGYPSKPLSHLVGEYNFRLFKQKQLIKNYQITIARARVTLYIMSAICAAGFGAVFLHFEKHPTRGIVLLIFSSVFLLLSRYTLSRPFTSLLISFLILTSFIIINTWAEMKKIFPSGTGVYLLVVQFIMIFFVFKGMDAAYQYNILEEEMKI
jgi:hypothetical protein